MTFIIVSIVSGILVFLALSLHWFYATHPEARKNIIYSVIARKFRQWLSARSLEVAKTASPAKWLGFVKGMAFWKYPELERLLFASFYGSFACLAASGFFYAFFVPRGLHGYPLLVHVTAGALFAVSLTIIVLAKGKNYAFDPRLPELTYAILDPKRLGLTAVRVRNTAFWLFALSGFLLTASALAPMLPLLRYGGQKLAFELHRYSALASVLAAAVFADLEIFSSRRRPI